MNSDNNDSMLPTDEGHEAFSKLFDACGPVLFGVAMRIVHSEEVAEQIVTQVFVKMNRGAEGFSSDEKDFLMKALQMTRLDSIEAVKAQDHHDKSGFASFDFMEYAQKHPVTEGTGARALEEIYKELEEKSRMVIDLAFFNGLPQEAVEHRANIPIGSMKPRLRRAMRELRTALTI